MAHGWVDEYAGYKSGSENTVKGVHAYWNGAPAGEFYRVLPVILDRMRVLAEHYNVSLEVADDRSYIYLNVTHRKAPTPADVKALKRAVNDLLEDTSWGGPG